ncbi:hypothetical protein CL622_04020 [archaeon]|nr:hypothetical protein [archaeon]|tara:strand:- start:1888 stop:3528 length:1641 start_codon:yes stop_codon:yes gene_type:complete
MEEQLIFSWLKKQPPRETSLQHFSNKLRHVGWEKEYTNLIKKFEQTCENEATSKRSEGHVGKVYKTVMYGARVPTGETEYFVDYYTIGDPLALSWMSFFKKKGGEITYLDYVVDMLKFTQKNREHATHRSSEAFITKFYKMFDSAFKFSLNRGDPSSLELYVLEDFIKFEGQNPSILSSGIGVDSPKNRGLVFTIWNKRKEVGSLQYYFSEISNLILETSTIEALGNHKHSKSYFDLIRNFNKKDATERIINARYGFDWNLRKTLDFCYQENRQDLVTNLLLHTHWNKGDLKDYPTKLVSCLKATDDKEKSVSAYVKFLAVGSEFTSHPEKSQLLQEKRGEILEQFWKEEKDEFAGKIKSKMRLDEFIRYRVSLEGDLGENSVNSFAADIGARTLEHMSQFGEINSELIECVTIAKKGGTLQSIQETLKKNVSQDLTSIAERYSWWTTKDDHQLWQYYKLFELSEVSPIPEEIFISILQLANANLDLYSGKSSDSVAIQIEDVLQKVKSYDEDYSRVEELSEQFLKELEDKRLIQERKNRFKETFS